MMHAIISFHLIQLLNVCALACQSELCLDAAIHILTHHVLMVYLLRLGLTKLGYCGGLLILLYH